MANIEAGDFAMHIETKSIYKVYTVIDETFVDNCGKIHQTKEYTKLDIGGIL